MSHKIFSSKWSDDPDWKKSIEKLGSEIKKDLGENPCDLLIFFVCDIYKDFDIKVFLDILNKQIPSRNLIGCNSSGIIGTNHEVEMKPSISLMAMHLPGVQISPFYLSSDQANDLEKGSDFINVLDIYPTDKPNFICLADPMSCDISSFLNSFNEGYKGLPMIGGLASGVVVNSQNWLSLQSHVYSDGMVGVALTGDIQFETVVSQGCRPIGKPLVITKAEGNNLYELAGKPTLLILQEIIDGLSEKDKEVAHNSLFAGIAMSEKQTDFKRGDFLVRNIVGFDPEVGTLSIGENLKVGQTFQFQLRDAQTSEEDLRELLKKSTSKQALSKQQGGILVSCCGRGEDLFGMPNHDVKLIQSLKGPLPLTGFFANGEIGKVGNKNYIHGYTSSLVILR